MSDRSETGVREIAFEVLMDIDNRERFAHLAVPAALSESNLDARDRALLTELVYGVIRRRLSLDWLLSKFSTRPISQVEPEAVNLLRLGLYQLFFMDKIPEHAAVSTSVDLSKKYLRYGADKFVNAVLRRATRENPEDLWPDRTEDEIRYLSVYYSHPEWLVKLWSLELGLETTESLLAADNERPHVTLRTNTLKITREQLIDQLKKAGVEARPGLYSPEAVVVDRQVPPGMFREGLAYVQDEASMLVGRVVGPAAGDIVVDIGAGPGGKTSHIAQLMNNEGRIIAVDANKSRLDLVERNCHCLGVGNVETMLANALESLTGLIHDVDRVLVDAPCSGLGVLARRPDSRWRKKAVDVGDLAALQLRMLEQAARLLRPGGILVYSVCTITQAETVGVTGAFLAANPEFKAVPFHLADLRSNTTGPDLPKWALVAPEGELQLWPHIHGTDGMFIAKLARA
jgi:16S rRNA (cytosine967-C5)-methyltransferase